jgi:hypothetical protein
MIVDPIPAPTRSRLLPSTLTCSRYVPAPTWITSPELAAASTAAWIVA